MPPHGNSLDAEVAGFVRRITHHRNGGTDNHAGPDNGLTGFGVRQAAFHSLGRALGKRIAQVEQEETEEGDFFMANRLCMPFKQLNRNSPPTRQLLFYKNIPVWTQKIPV